MSSSNNMAGWLSVAAAVAVGLETRADHLVLEDGASLHGSVRAITREGAVELESPLSPEPVFLQGKSVKRVTFSEPEGRVETASSRIELTNGDVLAVQVESYDGGELVARSPAAGKLSFSRESLRSLQLGIHRQETIYEGPDDLENWIAGGTAVDGWTSRDGILRMSGGGRISRELDLPEQFVVRFTLSWHRHPHFQLFFADPMTPAGQASDRYLFQFAGGGIEVRREAAEGKRFTTLVPLHRISEIYPGNRLKVEIRVDRKQAMLHLFLNDEPEGRYHDPVPGVPMSGGITIASNSGREVEHQVADLVVLDWNDESDRHRTEERGDPGKDSLIERRGDRYSGELLSISPSAEGAVFSFRGDFQEDPIRMPDTEVSTVFFRGSGGTVPSGGHPFVLRLRDDGALRVSSCVFSGERVEVEHPLLGPLVLERSGIVALEKIETAGGEP